MEHKHLTEEEVIDYVLSKLSNRKSSAVKSHLSYCEYCIQQYNYWYKTIHSEVEAIPSPQLKQRIDTDISRPQKKMRGKFPSVAISFCILMLLLISLFQWSDPTTPLQPEEKTYAFEDRTELKEMIASQPFDLAHLQTQENDIISLSQNTKHADPVQIEALYKELYFTQTNGHFQPREQSQQQQIVFMTNEAFCSYDPQEKQLFCIPIEIDQQAEQYYKILTIE